MPQKSFQKPEEEIHISIEVQISEEVKLREIKIGGTRNAFRNNQYEIKRSSVELQKVFLLDTANQVMQKVQKKLDAYFEKDAKYNLDNNLVLKFKNIESYLYGKE